MEGNTTGWMFMRKQIPANFCYVFSSKPQNDVKLKVTTFFRARKTCNYLTSSLEVITKYIQRHNHVDKHCRCFSSHNSLKGILGLMNLF